MRAFEDGPAHSRSAGTRSWYARWMTSFAANAPRGAAKTARFSLFWSKLRMKKKQVAEKRSALAKESERSLIELIRYRLSLPPEKRLNCLRKKIGLVATAL